jgi:hypothetical protein
MWFGWRSRVLAGTVVPPGGAWTGGAGGDLDVAQARTRVKHGRDEGVAEHVRVRPGDPHSCAPGNSAMSICRMPRISGGHAANFVTRTQRRTADSHEGARPSSLANCIFNAADEEVLGAVGNAYIYSASACAVILKWARPPGLTTGQSA